MSKLVPLFFVQSRQQVVALRSACYPDLLSNLSEQERTRASCSIGGQILLKIEVETSYIRYPLSRRLKSLYSCGLQAVS